MDNLTLPQFFTNPIQALHRLKDAGFTDQQAEVQIEVFSEQVEANLVSKRDLKELEVDMITKLKDIDFKMEIRFQENDLKFKALEMKMDAKFKEIDAKFKEAEMRLTIKMGAITSAVVGFFYLLEKFF